MRNRVNMHGSNVRSHHLERALNRVVRARDVPQVNCAHAGFFKTPDESGRLLIRQMPDSPLHPLTQANRIGAKLKQLGAIVRFEKHRVARREELVKILRNMTKISNQPELNQRRRNRNRNLRRIVRKLSRSHGKRTNLERVAPPVTDHRELTSHARCPDSFMKIHGASESAGHRLKVSCVISVLMRNHDRIGASRKQIFTERAKARRR